MLLHLFKNVEALIPLNLNEQSLLMKILVISTNDQSY